MPRRRKAHEPDNRGQDKRNLGLQQGGRFDQQQGKVRVPTVQQGSGRVLSTNCDASVDGKRKGLGKVRANVVAAEGDHIDTSSKSFVTFYITTFPERANYWFLRKGFEVCGILDDVYIASRCNA